MKKNIWGIDETTPTFTTTVATTRNTKTGIILRIASDFNNTLTIWISSDVYSLSVQEWGTERAGAFNSASFRLFDETPIEIQIIRKDSGKQVAMAVLTHTSDYRFVVHQQKGLRFDPSGDVRLEPHREVIIHL